MARKAPCEPTEIWRQLPELSSVIFPFLFPLLDSELQCHKYNVVSWRALYVSVLCVFIHTNVVIESCKNEQRAAPAFAETTTQSFRAGSCEQWQVYLVAVWLR